MIKLIASDLDGTLLQNGAQELTPRAIQLIHETLDRVFALSRQADASTTTNAVCLMPLKMRSPT